MSFPVIMKNITNNNTDNYSFLKTDIHSHLIPGLDDGVQSVEEELDVSQDLML